MEKENATAVLKRLLAEKSDSYREGDSGEVLSTMMYGFILEN